MSCRNLQHDGSKVRAWPAPTTSCAPTRLRLGFLVEVSDEMPGEVNGDCSHMLRRIRVRAGLSPAQSTKTLAHEIAHAILHGGDIGGREQAELEAESTAYIVCGALGIDSADYSFGYVAGWGGGEDAIHRIRQSGQRIQQTAQQMIGELPCGSVYSSAPGSRNRIHIPDDLGVSGDVEPYDVLDAAAVAWSALRIHRKRAKHFPSSTQPPPLGSIWYWVPRN